MRRATITFPDDLEVDLDAFMARQEAAPSLPRLLQAALRSYLAEKSREQAIADRDPRPARRPLKITVAGQGSGAHDVSIEHDRHLTTAR